MTQRYDNHPYMSKAQLNDYLASLRGDKSDGQPRNEQYEESYEDSSGRGSTPLVRALKERYGSGNTTVGSVDVGVAKGRMSPTKRGLPPVPGAKSENSTSWRAGQKNDREVQTKEKKQEELPHPQERSSSPSKHNDFWTTGVVRPLPTAPRSDNGKWDPRDELRMPSIGSLSIDDSKPNPPINAASTSIPKVNTPSINPPSIIAPSDLSSASIPDKAQAEKSWPNVYVRSRSSPALLCAACDKPIAGRIVTAIGSRFHPECFRCNKCSTELEHVAFYEHDGKVYCHLDYHELFSPRCKHCDTPIENEVISALGNKYHPGHFFCAGCGDPFSATTPFIVRDKYPWCEKCYENKYAPKCAKCRKPILDEVLNAMGRTWHPSGCFVCKECDRDFGDDGFFIDSTDGKPICKQCKHVRVIRQVEKIRP